MSDWLNHIVYELDKNPGLPLKEVINIAKVTIYFSNTKNKNKNNLQYENFLYKKNKKNQNRLKYFQHD